MHKRGGEEERERERGEREREREREKRLFFPSCYIYSIYCRFCAPARNNTPT